MAKKKSRLKHYTAQFDRTKKNKIRRIQAELQRNPNNTSAKKALEFWTKVGKKERSHKHHV